jgi:predicted aspartyl protease/Tfp pilus assembly protein PilF
MPKIVFLLLVALCLRFQVGTLAEADGLFGRAQFESAAQIYRTLIQQDSTNERAHTGLLRSLLRCDDVEKAAAAAEEAVRILPKSSSVLSAAGDILFRRGEIQKASEHYVRAIESDPQNGRAYLGLAKLNSSDFNRKSTRLMDQRAYECNPSDPEIILAYATDLRAAEQIPLLERYLELGVNEPEYRRDSAQSHLAFLKVMGDSPTWVLTGEPRCATIPLQRMLSAGRYTGYKVKVSINGRKPVDMHLDTGAEGILIHRKLARKLGVTVISDATTRGVGDEGKRKAFVGMAESVRIGSVEFRNCSVAVSEKNLLSQAPGLIGPNVFRQFLVTLDLPRREIRLEPLPAIQGQRYDDPESWYELDRRIIPELNEFTPIRHWGHLLLDTSVNGKSRGYFFLDTGAAGNFMSLDFARKVTPLQPADAIIRGISGKVEKVAMARNVSLQFGRFLQKSDVWAITLKQQSMDIGFEIAGLLGDPTLSQLLIVIDYRDGLLNLIYPAQK